MDAVIIFMALSSLLVIGKFLRVRIPLLQRLYLPSSVIGGLVGLAFLSVFGKNVPAPVSSGMTAVPGFLINVIFATLFLGVTVPSVSKVAKLALPQLCLGQIVAWGQYSVALAVAGLILAPCFGVPAVFGNLLEIGFEGGHGTVGGMSESFTAFGWEEGLALGYTMATAGMIIGVVFGMMLIQWAHAKGYVKEVRSFRDRSIHERLGIHSRRSRPSAGRQTVVSDSVDSLAWHIAVVGIAVMIGWLMHRMIPMKGFPLFPLCMIGGVILQTAAKALKFRLLVDHAQMQRIAGAALDFLVVSAVATIRLEVVAANWQPLALLIVIGALWTTGAVLFLSPRIFKDAWFERGIAEFGQACGVTATGLMLLRTVDPENRTPAAMSFGYKQLLHEPFMGGGIWTAMAFTLVYRIGWLNVWIISTVMLAIWCTVAFFLARNRRIAAGR